MKWSLCTAPARRISQSFIATCNARMVHLKRHPNYAEEKSSKPLTFSTSKASHRHWTFAQSLGSDHQQPWWKVLPICVTLSAILIWAAFRKETEVDEILYRPISEIMGDIEETHNDKPK